MCDITEFDATEAPDETYEDNIFDQLGFGVLDTVCSVYTILLGAASIAYPHVHNQLNLQLTTHDFLQLIWIPSFLVLGILLIVEGSRHKDITGVARIAVGLALVLITLYIIVTLVNGTLVPQVPQIPHGNFVPSGPQGPNYQIA